MSFESHDSSLVQEKEASQDNLFLRKAREVFGPIALGLVFAHGHAEGHSPEVVPQLQAEQKIGLLEKPDPKEAPSNLKGFERWLTLRQQTMLQKAAAFNNERSFACIKKKEERFCTIKEYNVFGKDYAERPGDIAAAALTRGEQVLLVHTHPPDNDFSHLNVPSLVDLTSFIRFRERQPSRKSKENLREIVVTSNGVWEYSVRAEHPGVKQLLIGKERMDVAVSEAVKKVLEEVPAEEMRFLREKVKRSRSGLLSPDEIEGLVLEELESRIGGRVNQEAWKVYNTRFGTMPDIQWFKDFWREYTQAAKEKTAQPIINLGQRNGILLHYQSFPKE